jgi:hypothetical protein
MKKADKKPANGYVVRESDDFKSLVFGLKEKKKNSGQLTKAYSHLVSLLANPENRPYKNQILSELKTENGKFLLLESIALTKNPEDLKNIVAACWETGHSFRDEIEIFVDLAVTQRFIVTIEALTVIESIEDTLPESRIAPLIDKVTAALSRSSNLELQILEQLIAKLRELTHPDSTQ